MCAPSPPAPPDYAGAAAQQGAANVETAKVQGKINNPNVVSPYGTQTVHYGWGPGQEAAYNAALSDYQAGGAQGPAPTPESFGFDPDQPTLTQQFSPDQQALYDQSTKTKQLLGGLGEQGATALQGVVGKQVDLSGLPAAPGSATDTRTKVYDAMMARVNEDADRRADIRNSNLIAAGIRPGSKAYDDAAALDERIRTDAGTQAYLASGQEASRDFALDSDRRRMAIAEYLSQRQVPLNEITALMSGSQVSNPFAVPEYAQNTAIQPPPLFAATNALGNYNTDLYNVDAANARALQGGLFSLGAAGLGAAGAAYGRSDRRLKSNIVRLRTHQLGIGVYAYDLDGQREVGVMADEVLTVKPEAVAVDADGYYLVNYALIGGRPTHA